MVYPNTLWFKCQDDIKKLTCDWCDKDSEDVDSLHRFEESIVCRGCLESEELEEDSSLTLEERNR